MDTFILTIKNKRIAESNFSGGKGSNLVILIRNGFNVPSFFILSSSLYEHIIKINSIDLFIANAVFQPSIENFSQIQSAIRSAVIPESIIKKINSEFNKLIHNSAFQTVAVRSSALAEDLQDHSFAGQLESYLNIQNEGQLAESIKQCWASLWNERVFAYLSKQQEQFTPRPIAVVVQQMIPVEISGICFTNDPRDIKQEALVIEAHRGIGEEIVGGKTIPTQFFINKKNLQVVKIVHPKGKKDHQKLLTEELLQDLARLCLEIEDYFNTPQDIEWGFYQGKFYFFQSRPVTTKLTGYSPGEKKLWTNYFFGERFPQPVSPLGWSLLKPLIEKNAFREPLQFLGFHQFAQSRITRCFFGRPYARLDVFKALHHCFPVSFVSVDKRHLFYSQSISIGESVKRIMKKAFPILTALLKTTNWVVSIHLRNWKRFLNYYCQQIIKIEEITIENLSDEQLWQANLQAEKLSDQLLSLHRWSITFAELIYHFIGYLIQKWLPQLDAEKIVIDLHRGLTGNKTVEMNIKLWQLSRRFIESPPDSSQFKKLALNKGLNRKIDHQVLESFLKQYGHRSSSLDIYVPPWKEDQNFIKDMIQQYLSLPSENSPESRQHIYQRQRKETANTIDQLLSEQRTGFLKKRIFNLLSNWSQQLILLRENQRFYWHQVLAMNRKTFNEMGKRFYERNLLNQPELIYFLTRSEITKIIRQKVNASEFARKVSIRFQQHEKWKKIHPPSLIDESIPTHNLPTGMKKQLTGIGVSRGIVSGKARVLIALNDMQRLQPDEILIVPTTDPGWTPLFGIIKGLVLEVGGVLSHGSIIAREFGIPAVTAVDGATTHIQSGMKITVDGNQGMVWISDDQ